MWNILEVLLGGQGLNLLKGNWTEQEFIEAVRFGKKPGGGTLSRPMGPHSMLTDDEVRAIHTYLKSVPVVKNQVQRFQASVGN